MAPWDIGTLSWATVSWSLRPGSHHPRAGLGPRAVYYPAMRADSAHISPTAHYTAQVWYRAGLSHPALATPLGRAMHLLLRPANLAYDHLSDRPSLEAALLARHRIIDHLLARAIDEGRVGQVLEIAAGLSPRGLRFARRYRAQGLLYVEGDLPDMAAEKRRRLSAAGLAAPNHRILTLDALAQDGPRSLRQIAGRELDPDRGTAIITEGLLTYFDRASVEGMWRGFAAVLGGFPRGLYLSDLHTGADVGGMRAAPLFFWLLGRFTRGRVHVQFPDEHDARGALEAAGFGAPRIHTPAEFPALEVPGRHQRHTVRIIACQTAAG